MLSQGHRAPIGRAGGQHLLDSFIQVTPELPGIFEAPSFPFLATFSTCTSPDHMLSSEQMTRRAVASIYTPFEKKQRWETHQGLQCGVATRTMCAELLSKLVTLALVFASFDPVLGTEATNPPEGPQERAPQQKGRLSLQNTGM